MTATALILVSGCATERTTRPKATAEALPTEFDRAVGKPPTPKTLNALARILATQGRDDECMYTLRKIITEHPEYLPAYSDLAEAYLRGDETDKAIDVISVALAKAPKDPILNNNLGMCFFLKGEHGQAVECFERAIAAAPRNASYQANRAAALALAGQESEAREAYDKILSPADAQANLEILAKARQRASATPAGAESNAQQVTQEAAPEPSVH
jgi:Flp pilus assembly protein TadD